MVYSQDLRAFREYALPENYEARLALKDLITDPVQSISRKFHLNPVRTLRQRESAHRVKVRSESKAGSIYLLFLNENNSSFSIAGEGNYIIKRDYRDGRFIQIKVFIRNHPDCFIRLFPLGDRSTMDVILFSVPIYRHVILPADFLSLLTAPFSEVMALSYSTVDWSLLLYKGCEEADRKTMRLLNIIREYLPHIPDAEDGAMDAKGEYVSISGSRINTKGGLNCSGFSKWIVDGFIYPILGRFLDIEVLKEKHLKYRGHRWSLRYEQDRDPYFGLDWSRNLAISLQEAQSGLSITDPEIFDVRDVEFLRYIEDVGYPVDELKLLLYLETKDNPGNFFIGSLNSQFGDKPALRQHFHLVVLFPFFTKGKFRVAVLERNQETCLSSLKRMYKNKNCHIHLVRLNSSGEFIPPGVE